MVIYFYTILYMLNMTLMAVLLILVAIVTIAPHFEIAMAIARIAIVMLAENIVIVPSGSRKPGTTLRLCSVEFNPGAP